VFKGNEGALRETIAAQQATIAMLERQYDKLFDAYTALRVSGANPTPTGLPPMQRSQKAGDIAIDDVCEAKGNPIGLRRILQRFVNLERQKPDADEDRIARDVRHWRDPESEDDAAA
jgi:hypothetical protein